MLGLNAAQDGMTKRLQFVPFCRIPTDKAGLKAFCQAFFLGFYRFTQSRSTNPRKCCATTLFATRDAPGDPTYVLRQRWTDLPADDAELDAKGGEFLPVHVVVPVNI